MERKVTSVKKNSNVTYNENVRIVGGIPAVPYSWPAQVLISIKVTGYGYVGSHQYSSSGTYMCGGTLIDRQTVLTAAHCIPTTVQASINGASYDLNVPNPLDPSQYI